jgi:hypothetical protein
MNCELWRGPDGDLYLCERLAKASGAWTNTPGWAFVGMVHLATSQTLDQIDGGVFYDDTKPVPHADQIDPADPNVPTPVADALDDDSEGQGRR